MNEALINIDAELMANNVANAFKTMHKSVKFFKWVIDLSTVLVAEIPLVMAANIFESSKTTWFDSEHCQAII